MEEKVKFQEKKIKEYEYKQQDDRKNACDKISSLEITIENQSKKISNLENKIRSLER